MEVILPENLKTLDSEIEKSGGDILIIQLT